jgi:uncharacterized protein YcgI (DUF1989 family)
LVLSRRTIALAVCVVLVFGVLLSIGKCHKPFGSRGPMMMGRSFFEIVTVSLVKMALQLSSHSWPMEINDPVVSVGKRCPCRALSDRVVGRFNCPVCVATMVSPLATWTCGPFDVILTLWQILWWSVGR